jgi:hypothetical protein
MSFDPPISAAAARRVARREAPPDARMTSDVRKKQCEQINYQSTALLSAIGTPHMQAELSRTYTAGRYRGIVGDILFLPIPPSGGC